VAPGRSSRGPLAVSARNFRRWPSRKVASVRRFLASSAQLYRGGDLAKLAPVPLTRLVDRVVPVRMQTEHLHALSRAPRRHLCQPGQLPASCNRV